MFVGDERVFASVQNEHGTFDVAENIDAFVAFALLEDSARTISLFFT